MKYRNYNVYGRGGGLGIGPRMITPFIKLMLITNTVVFIIQYFYPPLTEAGGLNPARFFSEFPNLIYQPFTYMFLHGGIGHIFFNMFVLWMFGTEVEATWGTRTFGKFYLISGVAGGIACLAAQSSANVLIIGASGAIYGVLVAYWLMFPERLVYLYFLFPIKVKWFVPGLMVLGIIVPFFSATSHTAYMAHLGGALYGLAYMKFDWRIFAWSKKIKSLKYKRQTAKLEKNRQQAEDIMKRVDAILDKINEVGIENISKADRKLLEEASSRLSKKKTE